MSEVKERLYETIDVICGTLEAGACGTNQIRLGRLNDGRIRLYLNDDVGDISIELTADNAGLLYDQLSEALGKKSLNIPAVWPVTVPCRVTYDPTGSTNGLYKCGGCGMWTTGGHMCVTCNSAS